MGLRENIWLDRVTEVELRPGLLLPPDTSVRTTIQRMRAARTGCILIGTDDVLLGIFTERDFVKRVLSAGVDLDTSVSQYMTGDPVTLKQSDSVGWAIRTMYRGHYRHLPVLSEQGSPIGIVSVRGIVQYLVDHVPLAVYNLPPEPGQVQKTREGA